jgi:hypothetical protein
MIPLLPCTHTHYTHPSCVWCMWWTMGTGSSFFSYFHITPLNYLTILAVSLLLYLGYLLLPTGLRAHYFGDGLRRRYRRRRTTRTRVGRSRGQGRTASSSTAIDDGGMWPHTTTMTNGESSSLLPPPADILESIYANSHSFSPDNVPGGHRLDLLFAGTTTPASQTTITTTTQWTKDPGSSSNIDGFYYLTPSVRDDRHEHQRPHCDTSPSSSSLSREIGEILRRPPGMMFVAHGTRCPPRPVWITLHHGDHRPPPPSEYRNRLTWRAELNRHRTATTTPPSSPPPPASERRLGNLRMVELHDVLGIELGKLTTALRRVQTAGRSRDVDCFSLLTRNGTLDLECVGLDGSTSSSHAAAVVASAEEVRAAFVTCLARAMSSRGLRLDGLSPRERIPLIPTWSTSTSGPSLQSKLQGLRGVSPPSTLMAAPVEGRTVHSGMMSSKSKISTVSF